MQYDFRFPNYEKRWGKFWRDKIRSMKDPHFAQAEQTLKPEHVNIDLVGQHISIVADKGVRTYAFANQQLRDRFVDRYRPHNAKPCKNPWP